ncbi:MAG TPA: HEAT repeat domain-containing protein [Candidatus Omnitrophota bacterium]|nr:HEAT repeat domain-containing protein [Candidatus Omnitrophota bacterium]
MRKLISLTVIFCLVFEQSGFAQVAPQINIPAYLNGYLSPDRFRPVHLRSLSFDQTTHNFNLLLDQGDTKKIPARQLEETTRSLFQYFQIGLALPNSMFWVNLRPDDPANVIDPWLEKTDLGKVLLEADLQLKKDIAALTSPDTLLGKKYWERLYAKAELLFGQADVSIPTISRPWIVPGEIILAQSRDSAYVYKATLKVMLEQDYIKDAPGYNSNDPRLKELNLYSAQLIRELILPQLTREVNSAKKYAGLRQVYYSLILAQWFKQQNKTAARESKDLTGLTSTESWSRQTYYQAYKNSFERGEYNKEVAVRTGQGLVIRRYFSGGIKPVPVLLGPKNVTVVPLNPAISDQLRRADQVVNTATGDLTVKVSLLPVSASLQSGETENPDGGIRASYLNTKQKIGWTASTLLGMGVALTIGRVFMDWWLSPAALDAAAVPFVHAYYAFLAIAGIEIGSGLGLAYLLGSYLEKRWSPWAQMTPEEKTALLDRTISSLEKDNDGGRVADAGREMFKMLIPARDNAVIPTIAGMSLFGLGILALTKSLFFAVPLVVVALYAGWAVGTLIINYTYSSAIREIKDKETKKVEVPVETVQDTQQNLKAPKVEAPVERVVDEAKQYGAISAGFDLVEAHTVLIGVVQEKLDRAQNIPIPYFGMAFAQVLQAHMMEMMPMGKRMENYLLRHLNPSYEDFEEFNSRSANDLLKYAELVTGNLQAMLQSEEDDPASVEKISQAIGKATAAQTVLREYVALAQGAPAAAAQDQDGGLIQSIDASYKLEADVHRMRAIWRDRIRHIENAIELLREITFDDDGVLGNGEKRETEIKRLQTILDATRVQLEDSDDALVHIWTERDKLKAKSKNASRGGAKEDAATGNDGGEQKTTALSTQQIKQATAQMVRAYYYRLFGRFNGIGLIIDDDTAVELARSIVISQRQQEAKDGYVEPPAQQTGWSRASKVALALGVLAGAVAVGNLFEHSQDDGVTAQDLEEALYLFGESPFAVSAQPMDDGALAFAPADTAIQEEGKLPIIGDIIAFFGSLIDPTTSIEAVGSNGLPITVSMNSTVITVGDVGMLFLDRETGVIRYTRYGTIAGTGSVRPGEPYYQQYYNEMSKMLISLKTGNLKSGELSVGQEEDLAEIIGEFQKYHPDYAGTESFTIHLYHHDDYIMDARSISVHNGAYVLDRQTGELHYMDFITRKSLQPEDKDYRNKIQEMREKLSDLRLGTPVNKHLLAKMEAELQEYLDLGAVRVTSPGGLTVGVSMNVTTITIEEVSPISLDRRNGTISYGVYWTGETRRVEPTDQDYPRWLGEMTGSIDSMLKANLETMILSFDDQAFMYNVLDELRGYENNTALSGDGGSEKTPEMRDVYAVDIPGRVKEDADKKQHSGSSGGSSSSSGESSSSLGGKVNTGVEDFDGGQTREEVQAQKLAGAVKEYLESRFAALAADFAHLDWTSTQEEFFSRVKDELKENLGIISIEKEGFAKWLLYSRYGDRIIVIMTIGGISVEVDKLYLFSRLLQRGNDKDRMTAVEQVRSFRDARAVEPLIQALGDSYGIRMEAKNALSEIGAPAITGLMRAVNDENEYVREYAAVLLGALDARQAVYLLYELLKDQDYKVRDAALSTLVLFNASLSGEQLSDLLIREKHPNDRIKYLLYQLLEESQLDVWIAGLQGPSYELMELSAKALGALKNARAIPALLKAYDKNVGWPQKWIEDAISVIAKANPDFDLAKAKEEYQAGRGQDGGKSPQGSIQTAAPEDLGGIDLRALPLNAQPVPAAAAIAGSLIAPAQVSLQDLDKQWLNIQRKLAQGPMPYQEIKAYVAACCSQQECRVQKEAVCQWLADILKLEEEAAVSTSVELKEILALAVS